MRSSWLPPRDPVRAATSAREHMIDAFNGHVGPQHGAEHRKFRTAETLASGCCRANRAMVLGEEKRRPTVWMDFGHVAFLGSHTRELLKLFPERCRTRDSS